MKNLLSENMMRFGTKNLSEAAQKELTLKSILETIDQYGLQKEVRKALAEQADPNLGKAQKIVGMIWTALTKGEGFGFGTDDTKVLTAVKMISTPELYKSVVNILRTSPKIKTEFGRNFPTVGKWLSTDMAQYTQADFGALDKDNERITSQINFHLDKVSGGIDKGIELSKGWGSSGATGMA
jgi:hypothetical protein